MTEEERQKLVAELRHPIQRNERYYEPLCARAADEIERLAALAQSDEEPVRAFAKAVLHGDDEHRAWLIEAAEAFIANKLLPVPRGKGAALPRHDASAGLIDAAERCTAEIVRDCIWPADHCTIEDDKITAIIVDAMRARAAERNGE